MKADYAILVVAAPVGEYEWGLGYNGNFASAVDIPLIALAMGLNKRLIVAINKMDDRSVNWSKERYDEITTDLTGK